MERQKYIKIFSVFIVVALLISLIMNFILLSKLTYLENQVDSMVSFDQNLMNEVNHQTSNMQHVLNEFKEEQSWISRIDMKMDEVKLQDGKAEATFEWQVKELQSDAKVILNYSYGGKETYTSIEADELQQGLFQVKVPFEVSLEPEWEVVVLNTDSHVEEMSKQEMEKRMMEKHMELKYYVSVSNENVVKSSEVQTEHLGYFGTNYYGLLTTDVNFHGDENFSVMVTNHNVNDSSIMVEKAYVLKYQGEELLAEEKMEVSKHNPPDDNLRFFNSDQLEREENMRLVVKVVYSNGDSFQKEVY